MYHTYTKPQNQPRSRLDGGAALGYQPPYSSGIWKILAFYPTHILTSLLVLLPIFGWVNHVQFSGLIKQSDQTTNVLLFTQLSATVSCWITNIVAMHLKATAKIQCKFMQLNPAIKSFSCLQLQNSVASRLASIFSSVAFVGFCQTELNTSEVE